MKFSLVLAVDEKGGIWKDGDLAWKIPSDMKYFKDVTSKTTDLAKHNAVIMGRKTWESIPSKFRPLDNRVNCILTSSIKEDDIWSKIDDFVLYFKSLERSLSEMELRENIENIFVIGWAKVYNEALKSPFLDKIYITKVEWDHGCDVFFDWVPENFTVESYTDTEEDNWYKFSYWVYKKVK